jgi:hypothetical protein
MMKIMELLEERLKMMDSAKDYFYPDCGWKELSEGQVKVINDICNDVLDVAERGGNYGH